MNIDLTSAAILAGVILGLVTLTNSIVFGTSRERVIAAVVLVISLASVMLVAISDFGHSQVVFTRPLDTMSFPTQVVVAILLAGGASALWEGFKTVRNIGQNQPVPPIAADEHPALTTAFSSAGQTVTGNPIAK